VHRSDGSGTNYIFSNHLSAVAPVWAAMKPELTGTAALVTGASSGIGAEPSAGMIPVEFDPPSNDSESDEQVVIHTERWGQAALLGCDQSRATALAGGQRSRLESADPDEQLDDWWGSVWARQAQALACGHGQVMAEYFDTGQTRMMAWGRRPPHCVRAPGDTPCPPNG
jgi:hypothetical protein